jgi:hypothetical protein
MGNSKGHAENRSFRDVLGEYIDEVPEGKKTHFNESTDLGIGLLNELFHAFKRPQARPNSFFSKSRVHVQKPAKPMKPLERAALEYFVECGSPPLKTERDLKKSFRRLARQFHPDSNPLASAQDQKIMAAKFDRLRQNYEILLGYFFEDHSSGV